MVNGELQSDMGTPLRGLLLPVDTGWTLDDFGLMESIAASSGLNAVHVYLENWTHVTGAMQSQGDALVSLTAQAGLYLVLSIGGGPNAPDHPGNGWFDPEKVRSFWSFYGARYKDSPHVIYEVQNNPERICQDPMSESTIEMEREAFALIRSVAPETHVVMFSTIAVPEAAVLDDAIRRVSDVVDWSNASVGLNADVPCVPLGDFENVEAVARSANVPLLMTHLPLDDWASHVRAYEERRIGWLHLRWLAEEAELGGLLDGTRLAELDWCPDHGDFPLAAAVCRER